ncbi:hypothetical protein WA171_005942, partial [Blastocystis sp. BT1]
MKSILYSILLISLAFTYSVDFEDLPSFLNDDTVSEEITRPEFEDFMRRFGNDYGYNGTIDTIRENDMKRMRGAVYLDYTGAGLYRESQVTECNNLLLSNLYGNAHSRSPSSLNTEHAVENMREKILKYFHASPSEYSIVFTSGATGALHTVGEIFPWSKDSKFYYLAENHNSVLGIREYAYRFGSGFRVLNEEDLARDESCTCICEGDMKEMFGVHDHNYTYSLFAFPAEDNFAGVKYPLSWIKQVQDGYFPDGNKWLVLLDAAAFIPTNRLDLSKVKPDFVTMSFYKIFGYPTGLGALLIRNSNIDILNKLYWGGGTVSIASDKDHFCLFHGRPCSRFEDGTISFLSIPCLKYGFDMIENLGIDVINSHVYSLTRYLYEQLSSLHHSNGAELVEIYGKHAANNKDIQGGIVAFNLKHPDGSYFGYYDIQLASAARNIHIRTGCHCNPGACRKYLNESEEVLKILSLEKDSCSDSNDMVNGHPVGGIRVSLGYMTTFNDIMTFVDFIKEYIDQ